MTTRIGTRASALARWQTDEVLRLWRAAHAGLDAEIVQISTRGDELVDAPLERMEGTGFFTSTIERALLDGRIDVAVHSMKDLPVEDTPDLAIAAIPLRGPVEDVLCARDGLTLATLPKGARVGTSSPRRTAQIRALRDDLECVALRGNVPTRLERVARGDLDAVVLARAGVVRLGHEDAITEVFALDRVLTAPAQGALAIQIRADDRRLATMLAPLDHAPTRRAVLAERTVLHALRGGCSVPVGAIASEVEGRIHVDAGVFDPSGRRAVRCERADADPVKAGVDAARILIESGAGEILAAIEHAPGVATWKGAQ